MFRKPPVLQLHTIKGDESADPGPGILAKEQLIALKGQEPLERRKSRILGRNLAREMHAAGERISLAVAHIKNNLSVVKMKIVDDSFGNLDGRYERSRRDT